MVSHWMEPNPLNLNGCEIGLEMSLHVERGKVQIEKVLSAVCDGAALIEPSTLERVACKSDI